VTGVQTCALPI
jgi:hypothetical protein